MVSMDALLDEHEVAVRAQVEELREEAALALAAAERALDHVSITRAMLTAVLSGAGQGAEQAQKADESGARGCADSVGGSVTVSAYRPSLPHDPDQQAPADCGMTALTVPETQRLLTTTTAWRIPANQEIEFHLAWSHWRRRHQARARWHHYRTRLALTA